MSYFRGVPGIVPGLASTTVVVGGGNCLFPLFIMLGSMSRGDGNHYDNMQQHSSLVYMHSSHQDPCLHFNGSTLVFATL